MRLTTKQAFKIFVDTYYIGIEKKSSTLRGQINDYNNNRLSEAKMKEILLKYLKKDEIKHIPDSWEFID